MTPSAINPEPAAGLPATSWLGGRGEMLGLTAWLAACAGGVAWFVRGGMVVTPIHIVLAMALVLGLGLLARRGWIKLFGPVLFYDLLRLTRRPRFFVLRWLYAVALLLLLFWIYWIWTLDLSWRQAGTGNPNADLKLQARLAENFFYSFVLTQFAFVVLLTPAYVAGSIAEEKERKTLEFLLATDLANREIVLGKYLSRLGHLALFLITGLPILSVMQFFGGIDPELLLTTFLITAITAVSLGAVSMLNSVLRRRARDAISMTYLAMLSYVGVASLSLTFPSVLSAYKSSIGAPYSALDGWLKWAVDLFNAGNPISGFIDVMRTLDSGLPLSEILGEVLRGYAGFHALVIVICLAWAVVRMRAIALRQAHGGPRKLILPLPKLRRRPAVGQRPMVWKEVHVEGNLRFGWLGRILAGLIILGSFVPYGLIVYFVFFDTPNRGNLWTAFGESVNIWLRFMNVIVSTLMLLGVAVRAAGSVGVERDRDTLINLMTTPLSAFEIIGAKWLGSLLSVRFFVAWLGLVWLIALLSGGVNLLALGFQVVAWLGPAAFLAALGLFFSSWCATTLRATAWTLMATLMVLGGHWICTGLCCFAPAAFLNVDGDQTIQPIAFTEMGLTPVFMFAFLPFRELSDFRLVFHEETFHVCVALAQVLWIIAATGTFHLALHRFRLLTNRLMLDRHDGSSTVEPRPTPRPPRAGDDPALQEPPDILEIDDEPGPGR